MFHLIQGENLIINGKALDNLKLEDFKEIKTYVKEESSSKQTPKELSQQGPGFIKI